MFVNKETGQRTPILPMHFQKGRLLVLMLDQGAIGTAGVAYARNKLGKNIHAKFDKIHRTLLVRRLNLQALNQKATTLCRLPTFFTEQRYQVTFALVTTRYMELCHASKGACSGGRPCNMPTICH